MFSEDAHQITVRNTPYADVNFSSKLFKVHAPRNFRNRLFKGETNHASITTQTNFDLVIPYKQKLGVILCRLAHTGPDARNATPRGRKNGF